MNPTFDVRSLTPQWCAARDHQPFFCEENVHRLLAGGALPDDSAALWISNAARAVAMWGQRAASRDPLVWDYHVVALLPRQRIVVDLDDRERAVRPLDDWLRHAFRGSVPPEFRPRFRTVERTTFLTTFSSDRSHMRAPDGAELRPFPPWPAPFDARLGMNLLRFVDLDDPIAGTVTDAGGLLRP